MRDSLLVRVFFLAALLAAGASTGAAQTEIYVRGSGRLFPIAVPELCLRSGGGTAQKEIAEVIARDLDLSGYFKVLNPGAYVEAPGKCAGPDGFAYSDWSVIGAEGLVRGEIDASGDRLAVRLYLHDVQRQNVVLGKEYQAGSDQARKIAHRFANEIMRFFTGEPGVFGTQIAYSSRVGRFKELFVMDMDGSNVRQLTNDRGLALSPSWHPSGESVLFTGYRNRLPDLFVIDLFSRRASQITRDAALELGAKFMPGAGEIIASRNFGDDSDIVTLSRAGQILRRISGQNRAIDVSPSLSPDGRRIAFCSNRAGGPQIYTMNLDGSDLRRVSFVSSNYCTSPAWSPKGDRIAFVCRADGGFQIFTANPDGQAALQLTSHGNNEDPDWSPDGRYLAFATTFGKPVFSLALMRSDGSEVRQLSQSRGGDTDPSWGPLLE